MQASLRYALPGLMLDVSFSLWTPWTVLFGPSGSGKSTLLRLLAGLLQPDEGEIRVQTSVRKQRLLLDTATGVSMPPHRRPVRLSPQSVRLLSRLSIRDNLGFAARSRGNDPLVDAAIQHFELAHLLHRRSNALSGGEQQQIAAVRAAVAAAQVPGCLLLLDEPFSALDWDRRTALLTRLERWTAEHGSHVLSVTHDIGDALHLGADCLRLADGRIRGHGPAAEVLREERERTERMLRGVRAQAAAPRSRPRPAPAPIEP